MNHQPRTAETDAAVRYIKAMQTPQWELARPLEGRRPPMNAGDYQGAAFVHICAEALRAAGRESHD
jgi:hypothetical protein